MHFAAVAWMTTPITIFGGGRFAAPHAAACLRFLTHKAPSHHKNSQGYRCMDAAVGAR